MTSSNVEVVIGEIEGLEALLSRHPHVSSVSRNGTVPLEFIQVGKRRRVLVGDRDVDIKGLIETMDNNPIVCADKVSVPTPASTLALVALAPLLRAGLIVEPPTLTFNFDADEDDVRAYLATEAETQISVFNAEGADLQSVALCTAMAVVATPERLEDLDDLYAEFYGKALYVWLDDSEEWNPTKAVGTPHALYRLRITQDSGNSLLTIHTMADMNGKCGAAQIVHAMNLMAGFEESLGISI